MKPTARAFWLRSPGQGEIRAETLPRPPRTRSLVRTLYSGVSRGTETLVFRGGVPENQHATMRAPFQEGEFPGSGEVRLSQRRAWWRRGRTHCVGRTVFCLYPHQSRYVVPVSAVTVVPDSVPAERAVLAGTVETAVNALWDAAPLVGDRIAVVGGGMVGCSVAALLARYPGVRVQLVDADPAARRHRRGPRRRLRAARGRARRVRPRRPRQRQPNRDSLAPWNSSRTEGTVIELSWYGDRRIAPAAGRGLPLPAGSPSAAARSERCPRPDASGRTYADRLALALDLLADPALDALDHRRVRLRGTPGRHAEAGHRRAAGAVPPGALRRRVNQGQAFQAAPPAPELPERNA